MHEKNIYTLGLCTMGTSSAALFKNGTLLAAVEEERLSRKKNDNSFPNLAIKEKSWQLSAIKLIEQTRIENDVERIYCIEARNSSLQELKHSIDLINEVIS